MPLVYSLIVAASAATGATTYAVHDWPNYQEAGALIRTCLVQLDGGRPATGTWEQRLRFCCQHQSVWFKLGPGTCRVLMQPFIAGARREIKAAAAAAAAEPSSAARASRRRGGRRSEFARVEGQLPRALDRAAREMGRGAKAVEEVVAAAGARAKLAPQEFRMLESHW
ncbi:MAG: hypothetical protein M1826_003524 [Phylliscum demangeonii]|nr:MAG: hypothetical protein M1826_003524 [Phylliscum demangeonii]